MRILSADSSSLLISRFDFFFLAVQMLQGQTSTAKLKYYLKKHPWGLLPDVIAIVVGVIISK